MRAFSQMARKKTDKFEHDCMNQFDGNNLKGCGTQRTAPFCRSWFTVGARCIAPLLMCVIAVVTTTSPVSGESPREVRGLWVVRDCIRDSESVERVVGLADSLRFNVLFVQIRGRGDAYYKSYFAPAPEGYAAIPDSFDPLAAVIELAHARGIEVHAWFNMYFTWAPPVAPVSPQHPLNRHPEWFMVSKTGIDMGKCPVDSIIGLTVEGRYLSPCLEPVRLYLSRIISEVAVNYDIDGVHLDYIRYPNRDYDFHDAIRSQFKRRYGIDPLDVVKGDRTLDPELRFYDEWIRFRARQIDSNVKDIARRLDLLDPGIRLSAAVKPDPDEAYYEYGQNWVQWLNEGIVDFVVPMSYYSENGRYAAILDSTLDKVDKRKIVGGIGLYRLDPPKALEQISIVRERGLLGYCLFSYAILRDDAQYARRYRAAIPSSNTKPPSDFNPSIRSKQ